MHDIINFHYSACVGVAGMLVSILYQRLKRQRYFKAKTIMI